MSSNELQFDWVATFLTDLSKDIDAEVVGEYICGILNVSHGSSESHSEIAELLSAYLPSEKSKYAATEIISKYDEIVLGKDKVESSLSSTNDIQSVEDQMRNLMQADCMRIVETKKSDHHSDRDPYTQAILRSTGVFTYQKNSDEERELEVAMANSEFINKNRSNPTVGALTTGPSSNGFVEVGIGDDNEDESDTDLEDIESFCEYGRKDDVKPGTVEGALSILTALTSSQSCGPSISNTSQNSILVKETSSPSSSMSIRNSHSSHLVDKSTSQSQRISSTRQKQPKKCPPPSKHIARIGAQAEAKQKHNTNSKASLISSLDNADPKVSRCKREDMEAFLFTDSDIHPEPNNEDIVLPEGGRNRERVIECEVNFRKEASLNAAKQRQENLEQRKHQLEKAEQRRQTANRKAQKVERRRL
ncbi:unnamed protein product [Schistosoma margrebowiei]|uniref:Coiled-coil domain-containing protein 43 n=1 Tax=Schistosoma margrebowiei TaxID=48269 RepID=A0A183MR19_9TREM|nr:unnamed protein product [Schistosoma margrebowiei]VDP28093.1 unnamed protein product [Schistosoma margrebowiei]